MHLQDDKPQSILRDKNESKKGKKDETKPKSSKHNIPLRILIIEPSGRYCRTIWCSIGLGSVHILIGAVVMSVLIYALQKEDIHAAACTSAVVSRRISFFLTLNLLNKMRMLIIDPVGEYWNVIFCAVGVGFVQMLIGGTLTTVLFYLIQTSFRDIHIFLCTFGYHFFTAEAILSLNYANGWSTPMRQRHRRFAHVILQMCAMAFAITGAVLITMSKGLSTSAHGLSGIITAVLSCITFLLGPCAIFGGRYSKLIHISFGIPTFIMSSICMCLGLCTPAFKEWAGAIIIYVLIGFVVFYTTFIMITCFIKCAMRV